ncbi:serpin (serine protease inhibitor) domain-containing protein [Ditylenchus destructor]|uniref:Serpin (Serine protease inhibitor) domain-containing protein n=1 Tax=Ditylenchus destructor TaxID=166010 RepID=A0AAD4MF42_9BILA|nr:serpin (serine protease inhibitor) domain-containing protein [Ditylenchus destructor]
MSSTNHAILEAQSEFGLNLLREVSAANSKASVVLSPMSVGDALSIAYAGALDETEEELSQLLAKGEPKEQVHKYFGALMSKIYTENKSYTLETANRIYVQAGFSILDSYKQLLNAHYRGQFESVDFSRNVKTANLINDFVSKATHEEIHDLIEPGSLGELTRLLLINAVYFKGTWQNKFDPYATVNETFYVSEGIEKQVNTMHKTMELPYHETDSYQVLGLPYEGQDVFMYVVLPYERYGLDTLLKNLTGKDLLEIVQKRAETEVVVSLPKFKIESTHSLTQILKELGLSKSEWCSQFWRNF